MINCTVNGWADCVNPEYNEKCHISIYFNFPANFFDFDLEEFLCENGWLYLNEEEAYCPACKKRLY